MQAERPQTSSSGDVGEGGPDRFAGMTDTSGDRARQAGQALCRGGAGGQVVCGESEITTTHLLTDDHGERRPGPTARRSRGYGTPVKINEILGRSATRGGVRAGPSRAERPSSTAPTTEARRWPSCVGSPRPASTRTRSASAPSDRGAEVGAAERPAHAGARRPPRSRPEGRTWVRDPTDESRPRLAVGESGDAQLPAPGSRSRPGTPPAAAWSRPTRCPAADLTAETARIAVARACPSASATPHCGNCVEACIRLVDDDKRQSKSIAWPRRAWWRSGFGDGKAGSRHGADADDREPGFAAGWRPAQRYVEWRARARHRRRPASTVPAGPEPCHLGPPLRDLLQRQRLLAAEDPSNDDLLVNGGAYRAHIASSTAIGSRSATTSSPSRSTRRSATPPPTMPPMPPPPAELLRMSNGDEAPPIAAVI